MGGFFFDCEAVHDAPRRWPIFLINICALSVYAFPLEDLAGRMETSVALLLTNVATRFTTSDYMPKVPYRTLCDEYLDSCFFFQFIGLVSNPLLYLGWRLGGGKKARWTSALGLGTVRYVELANLLMFLIAVFSLIFLTSWKNGKLKKHKQEAREWKALALPCLLYTSPSPRDVEESRMPSSA